VLAPSMDTKVIKPAHADASSTPPAIVYLFGAIDALVPLAYILNVFDKIDYWHAATLAVKLLLCGVYYKYISISRAALVSAVAVTAIILISSIPGGSHLSDYAKIFGFIAHLFVTLAIIRRENLKAYLIACASVLFVSTLIYLGAAELGHIDITVGRYSYFHHSHPNLGSEIIAMSVVLAACVFAWLPFTIVAAPSLYAIYLMQGRAAMIVALAAIVAKLIVDQWQNKKRLALIGGALAGLGALALLVSHKAMNALNTLFMLQDKYRGLGSGFVGRDQLWGTAWHWFLASPIIGNGAGFFDRDNIEVHNFFLFGLSEFGILSLAIYGMIFYLCYDLFRTNKKWFFCFIGIPVFWMFNDRFFNINPYPFLFYVVLFAHANTAGLRLVAPAIFAPSNSKAEPRAAA
jgi:O-antigen ligase